MKLKLTTYEYIKTPVEDSEIEIPDEPFYCFETGVRRSIRIIPVRFEDGKIYELSVTCVYLSWMCKVDKFTIGLHEIEGFINKNKTRNEKAEICKMLYSKNYIIRDKEQWTIDYETAINQFNEVPE